MEKMVSLPKLIIGGAVVGIVGLIYYLSDDGTGPSQGNTSLRRDQILAVMKDLKKEFGSVYITISTFANSVKEQSGGRLPEAALKEILITQTPIQSFIKKAEDKVYELHGVTETEFRAAVIAIQDSDQEINKMIKDMKTNLEQAYKGIMPTDDTPLPDFITPEATLKVLFDMYDNGKYITYKQMSDMKSKGIAPNPNSEEFMRAIQELEVEAEKEKNIIFEKHGLLGLEEAPMAILRKAQQKFSSSEPGFRQKAQMLEEEYSYSMQMIMEDKLPAQEIQRLNRKYGTP
ncbi:hypothetical protein SteCoe_13900 [Stentor coeruleus]|uniref:Uncharacterized protein n=1 Tax=Stentor coeruleus TaxID=5963 RepID=A0A1R2C7K1_9CILI|nr:hypothetical protein SteCoe_13900 [Stentor coeruleus]